MFTCLLKASLRARKWWSQDSTYSTHSLRLFPKLSLSVVHAGASAQQRDSSGVCKQEFGIIDYLWRKPEKELKVKAVWWQKA